jgi:hypothetical protein
MPSTPSSRHRSALFADIVRNPAFRDADIARIRGQWLADIEQEKTQPTGWALRTLPPLLYGKDHAYGIPFSGSGTPESIKSLKAADLAAFHRDFMRPDNVKIIVAGDTTLDAIIPQLEQVFGDWKAPASPVPKKNIAAVARQAKSRVFLINRSDSPQALILAGVVAPSTKAPNNLEIATANGAFGGSFTSRLNMNLREDKHWAYGAGSFLQDAVRPASADDLRARADRQGGRIGCRNAEGNPRRRRRQTADQRRDRQDQGQPRALLVRQLRNDRRRAQRDQRDRTVRPSRRLRADAQAAHRSADRCGGAGGGEGDLSPDALTWVIVGDLSKIEKPVRALNLGDVQVLDAEGKVLR